MKRVGNELLLRAISFAAWKHQGQLRKDGKTPYISHPFRVAMIVRDLFGVTDQRVLTAAVLHDVIEDTTTDFDDLEKEFGRDVATWVSQLSKDRTKSGEEKEVEYLRLLATAGDEVRLIKLADLYDNIMDVCNVASEDFWIKTLNKAERVLGAIKAQESEKIDFALKCVEGLIIVKQETGGNGNEKQVHNTC